MPPGLSPKHTIYAFSIYIVQIVHLSFELECEKNENKQKLAHFLGICLTAKCILHYELYASQ